MKKTLFLIGTFLLIEFGVALAYSTIKLVYNFAQGSIGTSTLTLKPVEIILILFVCNVLIAIASILLCKKGFAAPFKWHIKPATRRFGIIAVSIAAMLPLMYFTNSLSELIGLPDTMANQFQAISQYPIWAFCVIGILAPLAEELCFRYGICNALLESRLRQRLSLKSLKILAIVASSLLFSTLHMNPAQIFGATLLGIFLGWLYVESRSIWPSLTCHIFNNVIALVMLQNMPAEQKMQDFTPNTSVFASLIIGAFILAGILIWWLNRILKNSSIAQNAAPTKKQQPE